METTTPNMDGREALSFELREMLTMLSRLEEATSSESRAEGPFGEGFDF